MSEITDPKLLEKLNPLFQGSSTSKPQDTSIGNEVTDPELIRRLDPLFGKEQKAGVVRQTIDAVGDFFTGTKRTEYPDLPEIGELNKGVDIFIEMIDIVRDNDNKEIDMVPANADRQLFRYTYNPYFAEEYEIKEGLGKSGTGYTAYIIPASELVAILKDGSQITYNLWEKRRT